MRWSHVIACGSLLKEALKWDLLSPIAQSVLRYQRPTIYYVVDSKRWVQAKRLDYLARYLPEYRFRLLDTAQFCRRWNYGNLRGRPVYMTSWRIIHRVMKHQLCSLALSDLSHFMTSVTSHSNVGGGLDPYNPIPGRQPEEAFELALQLLGAFKVVTANSRILYELLSDRLPGIIYCPNGVDIDFFRPSTQKRYDPARIRVGWIGKARGPKNLPVVQETFDRLQRRGFVTKMICIPKNLHGARIRSPREVRRFYHGIDFYLCASWNEGTPNPALEAAACGVPVVTTRVGNMRELIKPGENGFFVEPTIESIVSQFEKINQMKKESYYQMSKNIRDSIIHNWSWEERIKNFVLAFGKLLGN